MSDAREYEVDEDYSNGLDSGCQTCAGEPVTQPTTWHDINPADDEPSGPSPGRYDRWSARAAAQGAARLKLDTATAQVAFAEAANLPVLDDRGAELVAQLRTLQQVIADYQLEAADVEDQLVEWMAERGLYLYEAPGLPTAERKGGTKRTNWKHEQVIDGLRRWAAQEQADSGSAIVACAGIAYWRTGELRKHGLDPDEYAEKTTGRARVILR